jgi:hypothetical protein
MMSVFPAPKGILQKIRAIQRDFLWRGAENKKKWALVAWEKVCRPKGKGGLGLQDPQVTNEAYGEKLWWRWVKDKSVPWENLWKAKYAPNINDQDRIRLMGTREGSTIWNLAWQTRTGFINTASGKSEMVKLPDSGRTRGNRNPEWKIQTGRSSNRK